MSEVSINSREKNRAPVTDFYRNQAFEDKSSDEDDLQTKLTFSIDRLLGSEDEPITDERKDRQVRMLDSADIHGDNIHSTIETYNDSEYCDQCATQSLMLQPSIVLPSNYTSFISDNVNNFIIGKNYVERTSNVYEYLNQERDYQYSRLPLDSFDERKSKMILKPLPLRFGNGYCDLEVLKCNTQSVYSATVLSTGLPTIVEGTSENDAVPYTMNSLTGLASIKALLQIEDFPSPSSSILQCKTGLGHAVVSRRKRSWSRAVFSNLQRKGLERTFQDQKYITKPERKRLAANLGLHDAQVKVWFQNRRMKWRHMIKSTQLPLIPGSVSIIKGSSEGLTATEHYSNTNQISTLNINENIEDINVHSYHGMKQPNNSEENLHDRLSAAELQTMAMRQQQQIDTQQQMLAAKEQRLRFLKSQETRSAVSMAEAERLRRLRERVEAQESKLRRLRALRGQVDLQKTYNVTLGNDLDSIRALFSEKEKELTLAVAKVEALTRQLEDLRRDRRGEAGTNGNLISFFHAQNSSNGTTSPTSKELEKLRLELAYRNQLSLQQNARLNMQKDALQQRQVELHSVDKRIIELQSRIHKKRTLNVQHYKINTNNNNSATAQQNNKLPTPVLNNLPHSRSSSAYITSSHARVLGRGNVVAVEPFNHVPVKQTSQNNGSISSFSTSLAPFDKMNSITHVGSNQTDNTQQHRQHQNQTEQQQMKRQQHYQRQMEHAIMAEVADEGIMQNADSDEKKIAARAQNLIQEQQHHKDTYSSRCSENKASKTHTAEKNTGINSAMGKVISKELELLAQTQDYELEHNYSAKYENAQIAFAESYCDDKQELNLDCAKLGKESQPTSAAVMEIPLNVGKTHVSCNTTLVDDNSVQPGCKITHKTSGKPMKNFLQNIPLGNLVVPPRKPVNSVAPTLAMNTSIFSYSNNAAGDKKSGIARKMVSGRNASSSNCSDKKPLNMINTRPALPPKPNKTNNATLSGNSNTNVENTSEHTVTPIECPGLDDNDAICTSFPDVGSLNSVIKSTMSDKQPIKAKPLTIRKQPFLEQPKLRTVTGSSTSNNSGCAPVAGKLAFITTSGSAKNISQQHFQQTSKWNETFNNNNNDGNKVNFLNYDAEDDEENESVCTKKNNDDVAEASVRPTERVKSQKVAGVSAPTDEDENTVIRKKRSLVSPHTRFETPGDNLEVLTSWQAGSTTGFSDGVRHKLARRVSFDPLALLLDASLEGELELVEKTAMQVTNPSAANDEGITALHNAICAGHFEIVKFLVNFGCDVNAQDSDGWTPLHCAASCNNLPMVKFLVESGACLFASTLSDHETPAEKCEEDEEGFDGCSEYLYSIQEKLGILNNGEVFAVFSYESQQPDELSFCINDKLIIIRKGDETEREWWWARDITSKEGYVPKNLLGLQPRLAPPSCMDDKH